MREGLDDQGTYFRIHEVENTTPVVFIHGVGLNHEIWNPQVEFFKKQTTITYDLFCHGKSTCAFDQINFEDFSNQINGLLQFLRIQKTILVGFSLGGLIAAHYASTQKEIVEKLILFGTIYGRTDEEQAAAVKRYEDVSKNFFDIQSQLTRWFNQDYLDKNPKIAEMISRILNENNHEEFLKSYKLLSYFKDSMIAFDEISSPTLIITGENEVGSTPKMSKEMGKIIKGSKIEIIKKGKHLCGIECAEDANNAFAGFIND